MRATGTRGSLSSKVSRSEEHTSELQSRQYLVCRLLLEKKKNRDIHIDLALPHTLNNTAKLGIHYFFSIDCGGRCDHRPATSRIRCCALNSHRSSYLCLL